jgi:hypothetical protein
MSTVLSDFIVFDYLRVHEITVEPKRIKATYTLGLRKGETLSNLLMYAYPEKVFEPSSWDAHNLASVMAVQVALNYGLFCDEIIFEGTYDEKDQAFLRAMLENTSREIYINKLLPSAGNEFLKPDYRHLVIERKKQYTAAKLTFTDVTPATVQKDKSKPPVELEDEAYMILSSGGKDSLLSYGILNELYTAHPVYVNESGRHWYTAYNAYHKMLESEPNTSRVWCNCDRIFSWMVRQMPFIRENHQNIRADIYPVRLWTVAVFLLGVLPLARKRKIRNIIIGNEYDTTMQTEEDGVTHYSALYDQSKYFDNAFSRYYARKGWDFYQFSLLRSLSELLILKILVKRYPKLQSLQVSCHAAHKEGDRMLPCGKCEKCRRIVGMLRSLDEDPARCGYTPEQIEQCLRALESKKVKQLGSDAQHLYHLLLKKELISDNAHTRKMARENPEIMQLRFDSERSMLEDLPIGVRRELFDLMETYTKGSVQRQNRRWETIDVEELVAQNVPYKLNKSND